MSELMTVKMSDGSNVLAVVRYSDREYSYVFTNPMKYDTILTSSGEVTTSMLFLPGTDVESHEIPSNFVMTFSPANEFYSRFYGSALFKFFMQKQFQKLTLSGKQDFSSQEEFAIEAKRLEIEVEFGMIDYGSEDNNNENKVVH